MLVGVAADSRLIEVAAPDGTLYLVGPGGFPRQSGGPFPIVAYPFGRAEFASLRGRPT
jgi:hypothetical protein